MTDHRAAFDASVTFGNGGDLTVHDFRVDVPSPDVTEDEIAALFVASLGLLMTDGVRLSGVRVFPEPHKGTRGGPSDRAAGGPFRGGVVPLDMPGTRLELPAAALLRADATETAGAAVTRGGNSSELARTIELPAVVVRVSGARWTAIDVGALAPFAVRGHAVLLQTQAAEGLTGAAARRLASQAAALVATDAPTLGEAREILLEAGIPVVESLTGLEALPPAGAFFSAVRPHAASGAAPARAYARVP
ncbi:hypothetical protein OUY22_19975 [Nonomuraea sp. MCN248]|uniref:Uncharacterized protein n=1 Tax=Nonomuraea corallina TaxID=2989783 RepID=A0ABT4SFF6_9ACTN|nr:hypothetical protein [Nonomuraea corallina]MDA0635705.1 hypothetical protein [Nonomuraea corallina]